MHRVARRFSQESKAFFRVFVVAGFFFWGGGGGVVAVRKETLEEESYSFVCVCVRIY